MINIHDVAKKPGKVFQSGTPNGRLLVVDNEVDLTCVLGRELSEEGYEVEIADDGVQALSWLTKKVFDLIILDIKMPNLDGYEVLKQVKANYPGTKVVMLTGYADLQNALESKRLGADDFLSKPYDLIDLFTNITRVLEQ